jgi:TatA/E family protein of Tat protein translocase
LGFDATPGFRITFYERAATMFGLSLGHIIILGVVVLLFGHRRLPELGNALGKGVSAFKRGLEGKSTEITENEANPKDQDKFPPKT